MPEDNLKCYQFTKSLPMPAKEKHFVLCPICRVLVQCFNVLDKFKPSIV